MVWSILRRETPDKINSQIKLMRSFKDMMGACFDVPSAIAPQFEDIFKYLQEERRTNYEVFRATSLPELKEDDRVMGGF